MRTIYFVRHATPDLRNKTEERTLSKKGMEDSKLVFNYLLDKDISLFVSSPYPRSVQTIEPLARFLGKEILLIDDFKERNVGAWVEDFSSYSKAQWNDFNYKLSGGESLNEVQIRNINALIKLMKESKDNNICVGTHGTALSTIINYYDKPFTYNDFNKIKNLMPWIVVIRFDEENEIISIEEVNLIK